MPQAQAITEQGSTAGADSETRASSKAEAKGRLLRSDVRPPILEEEPSVLEGGGFSTFRRRFIWQVHSSRFVNKPIPRVNFSEEHVQQRLDEVGPYKRHAGHSLTVETEDGYRLIIFMKRGMYDGVPRGMEKEIRERSENTFRNLGKVYPPLVPAAKDRRHVQALKSWEDRGLPWGRTHFMYWYEDGHLYDEPDISADSQPRNSAQLDAVKEFIKEVSWENEPIGKLIGLSDGASREKFHKHTQKLRQGGLLKHLDQGPHAVNSSIVAIVNMTVQPHRDPKDAHDGWTSTNTWGSYEGAWAVFPDLGIMIEQEPGDVMLCRSHYLEHWITEITSGQRYCCTRMTKENVINPLERWVRCPVPGCDWLSGRVASLRHHVQTKHFSLTDTEVQSIMATIQTDFPEYNTREIKSIAASLRTRIAEQENKEARRKTKMEAKQGAPRTNSEDLEHGLSEDGDAEAAWMKEGACGRDEEDG